MTIARISFGGGAEDTNSTGIRTPGDVERRDLAKQYFGTLSVTASSFRQTSIVEFIFLWNGMMDRVLQGQVRAPTWPETAHCLFA